MRHQRWCGLTARIGTVLSGVFSIMATHMQLIFERKHLATDNCTYSSYTQNVNVASYFFICWGFQIVLALSIITMLFSGFLLYSVYAQIYRGLISYAIWILCYESANLAVQILTQEFCMALVRAMRWFGWISRSCLHCFWMFFVITHARIMYNSQKQGNILTYHRGISMATGDSSRQKSRSLSFVYHYGGD